jgi:hypothetical protein
MRVSFDLDEVLFVNPEKYEIEKPPRFPLNRLFPERLRKGTVDLVHKLQAEGFEVWVYTSSFRSETYIRSLFRNYGVRFDDIVNGARHQQEVQGNRKQTLPTKVPSFYHISLHLDDEEAVIRNGREYGFKVMRVYDPDAAWADKILEEARRIRAHEEAAEKERKK